MFFSFSFLSCFVFYWFCIVLEGFGGVPPIRPLETLHNALSLKHIDTFLEKMTMMIFKTPASSPPKNPSTPIPTPTQTPQNSLPRSQTVLPSEYKFVYYK